MSTADTEVFEQVCEELIDRILTEDLDRDEIEPAKRAVCAKHAAPRVPKNSELLERAPEGRRDDLEAVLRRKPVRTASGVSPVAIMTSPQRCPHGQCLYCPGGPDSAFDSAQSYTGHEPAASRGKRADYDPYEQVRHRLQQLRQIGHPVDKVDLILMGGTMTARSHDYQEWFVKRALQAMNDFDPETPEQAVTPPGTADRSFEYLEDVIQTNETATVRNIGTTFETKPDWCGIEQIDRMLRLGGTKVEVGVQTTFERINREMGRGHGIQASIDANCRLRDAGFKVGFHMMPGQPGSSKAMALTDFDRLFERPEWRPDYLKIYPTLVVGGTVVYGMHRRGEYEPLSSEEAAEVIAQIKAKIPPYTRLQRVQRDIPADFIEAGVQKSNLRQLARDRLTAHGETCDCIRCREVGHNDHTPTPDELERRHHEYASCGGTEHFLSIEAPAANQDVLVGFVRLRFPNDPHRPELQDAAIVRELHVYGSEVGLTGDDAADWQHQGYGQELMGWAEEIARAAGFRKLAVISGIGAREYYKQQLGYEQDGPYVSTRLS